MVREGFSEEVLLKLRWKELVSHAKRSTTFQAERTARAKTWRQESDWLVQGTEGRRPNV